MNAQSTTNRREIKLEGSNPCVFTVVREMKFTGLFDAS